MMRLILMVLLISSFAVYAKQQPAVFEGENAVLYDQQDDTIKAATLYYRIEGNQYFLQQPLLKQGKRWIARLNAGQLRAPSIEYYLAFIFQNGSKKTQPVRYPKYNPLRILVNKKQGISLHFLESKIQKNEDVSFEVSGYVDAETRVFIDDIDVTDFVEQDGQQWVFKNESNLFSGKQTLRLVAADGTNLASNSITFIDASTALKNRQLAISGNSSFSVGGQADSGNNSNSSVALSANMHVEAEYKEGDFSARYSGIDVNYQHGADEPFNLSAGFLLQNKFRNHSLDVGDVSVNGTPLVIPGFSRRGFVAKTENDQFSGSIFNLRTSTVDGFDSGISFDDRQTYGGTIDTQLGTSNVQVSLITGELKTPNTVNVGSSDNTGQSGDSVGFLMTTELAGTRISAEVATSKFDADTSDNQGAKSDSAYEVNLSRDIVGLASTLGFHHYGANYATIANPNFSNDREGVSLSLGSGWRFLNWSTSFSTTVDNVEEDITRPIVTSNNTGINLGFVVQNWPSINLGFNVTEQISKHEPSLNDRIDNEGFDYSLGVSDTIGDYNVSWTSSIGHINNNLDASNDSDTLNHALTVGFNVEDINVNISLSQNKAKSNATLTSNLLNLSLNIPLFSDKVTLNSQFSVQDNTSSDNSQNNSIIGGSANISWALKDMYSGTTAFWADTQFSLSWRYNKTKDAINSAQDSSDNVLMLTFSFGAPTNFEYDWQF